MPFLETRPLGRGAKAAPGQRRVGRILADRSLPVQIAFPIAIYSPKPPLWEIEMAAADVQPWPTELRVSKDKKTLAAVFDNGESFSLAAEYLRVTSPSAEVQGHSPDERKTVPGKRDVAILEVHPVGNYAVRLVFDDLHSTGIYSWDYLLELGRGHARKWQDYLDELAVKGLSREPSVRRR
jgi:DUF971 family protein